MYENGNASGALLMLDRPTVRVNVNVQRTRSFLEVEGEFEAPIMLGREEELFQQ
jgi:hypothetical protein